MSTARHTPGRNSLDTVRTLDWVAHVDDERDTGSGIIVTLADGYEFAIDPGCGVRGFDTVREVRAGTKRSAIAKATESAA